MGRSISVLSLLLSIAALVWAGMELLAARDRIAVWKEADRSVAPVEARVEATDTSGPVDGGAEELAWLPIFGLPERPQAAAPEAPVEEPPRFDYTLKGVIASDRMRWAVLSTAGQDLLVREGDTVEGGGEIVAIRSAGIDVQVDGRMLTLNFSDSAPVEVANFDAGAREASESRTGNFEQTQKPRVQKVIFQDMTREELMVVLQEAERNRRARAGIVSEAD